MSSRINYTDEQEQVITLAKQGYDICVRARAGTGKSSNIIGVGESTQLSGLVLVFLRNNANELNLKLPFNFEAQTINSLAWQNCGYVFGDRVRGRLTPKQVVDALQINKNVPKFTPYRFASMAMKTINNFCMSADKNISEIHIPLLKKSIRSDHRGQIEDIIKHYATRLWVTLIDRDCKLSIGHDIYLKLYQLSDPTLPYDIVALDEGQDSNPVTIDIFRSQYIQKIIVGDDFQQIYAWRGAVNALDSVDFEKNCFLTKSFRFGQPIAELATKVIQVYTGENVSLTGNDLIESHIIDFLNESKPTIEICRTNTKILSKVVSLIENEPSIKICIKKGIEEMIALIRGMMNLKNGLHSDSIELSSFDSWFELIEYSESGLGGDFVPLIKIINSGQVEKVISVLEKIKYIDESSADICFVTAHSSKGMEWDHVKLGDDFPAPMFQDGEFIYPPREEINLLYVAVTRAIRTLDISECFAAIFAHKGMDKNAVENTYQKFIQNRFERLTHNETDHFP